MGQAGFPPLQATVARFDLLLVGTANASNSYRVIEMQNAIANIERAPVLGLGFGNTWSEVAPLPGGDKLAINVLHNTWLWMWMKTGIIGFLAFLWMGAAFLWMGFRAFRGQRDPKLAAVALALLCAFIAQTVMITFEMQLSLYQTTVAIGVLLGLLAVLARDAPAEEGTPARIAATPAHLPTPGHRPVTNDE